MKPTAIKLVAVLSSVLLAGGYVCYQSTPTRAQSPEPAPPLARAATPVQPLAASEAKNDYTITVPVEEEKEPAKNRVLMFSSKDGMIFQPTPAPAPKPHVQFRAPEPRTAQPQVQTVQPRRRVMMPGSKSMVIREPRQSAR